MKTILCASVALAMIACLTCPVTAQIKATTQDGKKVILGLDGTWKYDIEEIEKDTALLKNLSSARDTASAQTALTGVSISKDSAKTVPAPPPVPVRTPPNLDCSALLAVNRAMDNQSFVATLNKLVVSQDSKTGFIISLRKTKHKPVTWNIKVMGAGVCINEKTEMILLFKDGSSFKFYPEGPVNCEGNFKLTLGGEAGNDYAFDLIKQTDIKAIRIWNAKMSTEQYVHEYDAAIFKTAVNCLLNLQ